MISVPKIQTCDSPLTTRSLSTDSGLSEDATARWRKLQSQEEKLIGLVFRPTVHSYIGIRSGWNYRQYLTFFQTEGHQAKHRTMQYFPHPKFLLSISFKSLNAEDALHAKGVFNCQVNERELWSDLQYKLKFDLHNFSSPPQTFGSLPLCGPQWPWTWDSSASSSLMLGFSAGSPTCHTINRDDLGMDQTVWMLKIMKDFLRNFSELFVTF